VSEAAYRLELSTRAQKDLRALARADARQARALQTVLLALAQDPRPAGCRKLAGPYDLYRIRVGDHRILYRVEDTVITVTVARVANRREAYEHLDNL
jgi:mRNA interferase RelE/StbE